MRRFRGKEEDIRAYLGSYSIEMNALQLCQELERLSDDAIHQLWEALGAQWAIGRRMENAYWDGVLEGREEAQKEAYEEGFDEGEQSVKPDDFPSVMLFETLKKRGLCDEVTVR